MLFMAKVWVSPHTTDIHKKDVMERNVIVGIIPPPAPASGNQQDLDSPPEGAPKEPFRLLRM